MIKMYCPICGQQDVLVLHHDHFEDVCHAILVHLRNGQEWDEWKYHPLVLEPYPPWATFIRTYICDACNHFDAEVKMLNRTLPRWVSFSPEEIFYLKQDSNRFDVIWAQKNELYRQRLRRLTSHGVSKEVITEVWCNKDWGKSRPFLNKRTMLSAYADTPAAFKELCDKPGNERQLAVLIRQFGWDSGITNSFIFWYHKLHGDPGCKNNQFGVGPSAFAEWWNGLAHGNAMLAEMALEARMRRSGNKS
jgi:hypothetical protein